MFEFSVACKYLLPRRRQLSVSIISLISIFVIALVVWLIVVFFSVTDGLEKNWIHKLTALTAPVRVTPTEAYYQSYYYQIDSISDASNYSSKTIREKLESPVTDSYDPTMDEEIPAFWPQPDLNADGSPKDLVKLAYQSIDEIHGIPGLSAHDFELTASHIRLRLLRKTTMIHGNNIYGSTSQSALAYPAYLGNFEVNNPNLNQTLLPVQQADLNNFFNLLGLAVNNTTEESVADNDKVFLSQEALQTRLKQFFSVITIKQLKSRPFGWLIPRHLLPPEGEWKVCAVLKNQKVIRLIVPQEADSLLELQKSLEDQGLVASIGTATLDHGVLSFVGPDHLRQQLATPFTLTLAGGAHFPAQLDKTSLDRVKRMEDVRFTVEVPVQKTVLKGNVSYRGLEIAEADINQTISDAPPPWVHQEENSSLLVLPKDEFVGEGVILPKSFRDAGVLLGDRGSLSYVAATASVLQEQHLPIYVAGFYDPGIIPIGGKFVLANPEVISLIRSSHQQEDKSALTNGINVRFNQLDQAGKVKAYLEDAFKAKGINRYWTIETYREYEFTKEIMQELQSQKNLFLLIAIVIILVACSNIISMLIILVNDKKTEIGILRSMGASSQSIALIFGTAGAAIGVLGSLLGISAAIITLNHLDVLIRLLSSFQGHDMFSTNLYGQVMPHELSWEALSFVLGATVIISLLAGIVPAIKACLLRPSHILRSSGG